MKANIGPIDGAVRVLLFVIAICYAVLTGAWYWVIPTGILFVTAVLLWCPTYDIFGISSNKQEKDSAGA